MRNIKGYLINFGLLVVVLVILFSTDIIGSPFRLQETQSTNINEVTNTVEKIKNEVKIGLTMNEMKELYGSNYIVVNDNGDLENGNDEHWKYRLLGDPNYKPTSADHEIDEEGILSGKAGVELFIGWKDEKITLFTISYLGADKHIHFYSNVHGNEEESIIK
ncbi:hypothetical protein [Brevibacillus reuszeri]|uniref:hypothetical protein n=1 Tax=Brevibacillus reuszeri TaxID=54915 RepID=UPI003D1B1471